MSKKSSLRTDSGNTISNQFLLFWARYFRSKQQRSIPIQEMLKMRTGISIITLVTGMACSSVATAQWFGPWGNENDLATAWGLEESSVEDPDEGPGETIDYGSSEQLFGMSVQSGGDNARGIENTPPPVVSAPPARAKRTPPPPVRVERRAERDLARDRYRRMAPPGTYRGYPPPRRSMPYYPQRRALPPPRRVPPRLAPLPPYPRYRR